MKKSIAFIGALFMGSIAFAQVSKNDNTNKTASRKVLDADVKDLPSDPEANTKTGEIKGEESNYLKVTDNTSSKIKGSITQKSNASKSAADPYLKMTSEKKSADLDNTTIKVSGTQGEKSASDPYLKVTSEKKSTNLDNTTIKVSGTQAEKSASDPYLKVTSTKKE
ncbi:MAG: hypothetical protein GZ087_05190 [Flavobacterium sp.]|nr:hypothetical protein [Flavobacterium sp.]